MILVLNIRFDFSLRDGITLVRQIETDQYTATAGIKTLTIKPSIDYKFNDNMNLRMFYNRNVNTPVTSNSFPTALTDFGIAGLLGLDPESQPRGGGSLPAMSPQQLVGEPVSVADDVYGFGALLFDLIAGMPLFGADPSPARVQSETPPRLSAVALAGAIPAALDELVASALAKEPAQRPATMAGVLACLESLNKTQ